MTPVAWGTEKVFIVMGIWNGFASKPHVLPQACVICAGEIGGEFIQFACGHGGIDQDPLHVACAVESFNPPDPDAPQPARCPLCREEVDQDTLAILADYVQRNAVVAFPNDDDRRQRCLLYTSPSPRDKRQSRMPSSA